MRFLLLPLLALSLNTLAFAGDWTERGGITLKTDYVSPSGALFVVDRTPATILYVDGELRAESIIVHGEPVATERGLRDYTLAAFWLALLGGLGGIVVGAMLLSLVQALRLRRYLAREKTKTPDAGPYRGDRP